ncbi:extracellular solute-binding protein [Paenibacillus lycopersici]|uniref:Extracellular solute-binding protein n=1 Tax=Paenibacillus lycopersici TaxID=2704462 RepID=A0A6C0G1B1_9BACL|nr:extracellular solute-binding protein [Paenibacillus lycopersici]QHT60330.1 extracellular solute-binding protein [Paenibacillus lycopersici]
MSRRKVVILLLSLFTLCAALLVSLTGKPGSPVTPSDDGTPSSQQPQVDHGAAKERKTLSIAVSMDEAEFQYWNKRKDWFELNHANIAIALTNIRGLDPDDARKTASEAGEPFDVMLLDDDRVREFAMQGYLLPVDEIVTGDSAADLLEALTGMVKWNGSLWGVPVDSNPLLNVWSRKLLSAAGVQEPPKTMEAFKALAAALSTEHPGNFSPFNLNTSDPRDLSAWLGLFPGNAAAAAALSPFTASQKEQLRYAAEHNSELLRFNPLLQTEKLMHAFQSQQLLSAVVPWTTYFALTDDERSLLTIGSANGPIVRTDGRSFVLTAETDKAAEAREWIQYMTGSSAELERYRLFGRLPARVSVMTGEFEYNAVADKPPHFLAPMLKETAAAPDPPWRERWIRWESLSSSLGGNSQAFGPGEANALIAQWNGETDGQTKDGAEAPSRQETGNESQARGDEPNEPKNESKGQ